MLYQLSYSRVGAILADGGGREESPESGSALFLEGQDLLGERKDAGRVQ